MGEDPLQIWVARLRLAGLRVTPVRLDVLRLLERAKTPVSIADLKRDLKGKKADQATVYRTLEAFADAGVVKRVDFQHGHAHYELDDETHHHHIVCITCGDIEDIDFTGLEDFSESVLNQSKKFIEIRQHSLEFFGLCQSCAKKIKK